MRGREEVRPWIWKTMETLPRQLHDVVPVAVVGDRRADRPDHLRARQPDARPRRRHDHQRHQHLDRHLRRRRAVVPAGGHLQPAAVRVGDGEVVPQGRGTRHAARRGGSLDEADSGVPHDRSRHRRQRLPRLARHPPTRRRRAGRAGDGARRRQHDRHRRPRGHAVRRRHLERRRAARGDGRLRRRLLLRRRHPRLAAGSGAAVPHQRRRHPQRARDRRKDAGLQRFVFTSSYVTVGRKRGRVATEDDVDRRRASAESA